MQFIPVALQLTPAIPTSFPHKVIGPTIPTSVMMDGVVDIETSHEAGYHTIEAEVNEVQTTGE